MFTSDLRIRTSTGLTTYPDAAVVRGKTLRAGDDAIAVTNPCLLVEVTSPSTENYDRDEKPRHYKSLLSVREILIVSHREPRITLHRRETGGDWYLTEATAGGVIELASVAVKLVAGEVYRGGLEDTQ